MYPSAHAPQRPTLSLPNSVHLSRLALRLTTVATILTVATGCDKARGLVGGSGGGTADEPPVAARLDLSSKPDILFQVFGEQDDPRMIPVAALGGGTLRPIVLASDGWKAFDSLYTRAGASYTVYQDGRALGAATVRRGMWEGGEPLYTLPSCRRLTPLAAVTVTGQSKASYTVELLASSATLGRAASSEPMSADAAARAAREVGYMVAQPAYISRVALDSLDFRGVAIATGASDHPTIVASFIDPNAEGAADGTGQTTHVFALGDWIGGKYVPTFTHAVNGSAAAAMYRRYVDHLDVTGDGIDEMVLEAWQYGGVTYLSFLSFKNGKWEEIFRSRSSWCLDETV